MKLQRGRFLINNISELDNLPDGKDGIKKVIDLDYMGQFEFEGNTIPISRMVIEYYKKDYVFYPINIVSKNNEQLFIYIDSVALNSFEDGYIYNYVDYLIKNNYSLWEAINGESTNNFWWDIQNNMFIFLGKEKEDIIKYFIDNCYERDNKGEGIAKKLEKVGYKLS